MGIILSTVYTWTFEENYIKNVKLHKSSVPS